jgi:ABC-type glycerol-3-phosphate transport system substrate-binding protein
MTNIFKSMIRSIFCCLIIFSMLVYTAGCTENNNAAESSKAPAMTLPTELQTIKICFVGYSSNGQPANLSSINEMLAELNIGTERDLNTRVEFMWLPYQDSKGNDYITQLTGLLDTADAPDAFMMYSSLMTDLKDKGHLKDLTDLIREYAPEYYKMMMNKWGAELDYSIKINDRIFAIPSNDFFLKDIV